MVSNIPNGIPPLDSGPSKLPDVAAAHPLLKPWLTFTDLQATRTASQSFRKQIIALPSDQLIAQLENLRNSLQLFEAGTALGKVKANLEHANAKGQLKTAILSPIATPLNLAKNYFFPLLELLNLSDELRESHVPIAHLAEIVGLVELAFVTAIIFPSEELNLIYKNSCINYARELYATLLSQRDQLTQGDPDALEQFNELLGSLERSIQTERQVLHKAFKQHSLTVIAYLPAIISTIWHLVASMAAKVRVALSWAGGFFGLILSYRSQKSATKNACTQRVALEDLRAKRQRLAKEPSPQPSPLAEPQVVQQSDIPKAAERERVDIKKEVLDLLVKKQEKMSEGFNFQAFLQRVLFGAEVVLVLAMCGLATAALFTGVGAVVFLFPQIGLAAFVGFSIGASLYYWLKHRPNMAIAAAKNCLASFYYPLGHMWRSWRVKSAEVDFWHTENRLDKLTAQLFDVAKDKDVKAKTQKIKKIRNKIESYHRKSDQLHDKIQRQRETLIYWENKASDLKIEFLKADLADLGAKNWTFDTMINAIKECAQDANDMTRKFFAEELGLELVKGADDDSVKKALLKSTFAKNNQELISFIQARSAYRAISPPAA